MENQKVKTIGIYHEWIPKVGGIESAVFNLGKELDKIGYKVTVYFMGCESWESLFRYAQVCDVVRILPEHLEDEFDLDVLLVASNHYIPRQFKAKRIFQWVHSDYDRYKLDLRNKGLVEYVAVSKHAKKVIERREKVKASVIYNLVDDEFGNDSREVFQLVTNSRVSPEKGFDRMIQFAQKLDDYGVRYIWTVYGDNSVSPNYFDEWKKKFAHLPNVHFVGYKPDVTSGLQLAKYSCLFSDFEGCPYSVLESLKMGVPCLVTNWLGVDELITDGENGYILPMDMDIDDKFMEKIISKIPKVVYKPLSTIEDWVKIIQSKPNERVGNPKA